MEHFCHNCKHWSFLPDRAFCKWCLDFFYAHSRLPLKTDNASAPTVIDSLFTQIGSLT